MIDFQFIIDNVQRMEDGNIVSKVYYEDDEHKVTIYSVTADVIRVDIKNKGV